MLAMVNRSEFGNWLQGELDKRGWRQAELARRAGVTRAGINGILPAGITCDQRIH